MAETARPWQLRRHIWAPLLVLALGLLSTGLVTRQLGLAIGRADEERFLNHVQSRQGAIIDRLNNYAALLRATAGMFAAHPDTTAEEFARYFDTLEVERRYPGMQGLGFTRFARGSEAVRRLDAELHRLYGGEIGIWPAAAGDERHAIVYIEPVDQRNAAALGYDMFTDPVRRAAMEQARDSGALAASGAVTLVQEIDPRKQKGFLLYMPVYSGGSTPASVAERRARLQGFAYAPFRVGDLFARIFGSEARPRIGFELYDGARPDPQQSMYRSATPDGEPQRTLITQLEVAGRTWTVRYFSLPPFDEVSNRALLPFVAAGGALLSLLFAGIVAQQIRARSLGEQREAALQASEARFRQLANTIPQLAWSARADGHIFWFNQRWYEYTGTTPAQMEGDGWHSVHDPQRLPEILDRWQAALAGGGSLFDMVLPLRGADGTYRPFLARVAPLRDESGQVLMWFGTHTDVSEQEQAAQERERLLRQAEKYAAQMRGLAGVSPRLHAELDVKTLLTRVTEAARELVGAHQAVTSLTRGPDMSQSIDACSMSEKYAAWSGYDAPTDGSGIYALVCRENRAMRLTQAELEAHPAWHGFGAHAGRHPPMRGWLAAPLVASDGHNLGLIQLSDKIEGEFDGQDEAILVQLAQLAASAVENARLYAEIREGEARMRLITESVKDHAIITTDVEGRITGWNPGAQQVFGYAAEDILGRSAAVLFTPEDRAEGRPEREMRTAVERGLALDERVHLRSNGRRFFASGSLAPLRDEGGQLRGFVKVVRDMTEQRQATEQRELLIAELNHRVKNTLAIVQSIAQQTRRATDSLAGFQEAFIGRLHALARTHDLLTRERWEGASLEDILRATLAPYAQADAAERLRIAGPMVRLAPQRAVSLSMAFHELATNAAKYGALSRSGGHVDIGWTIDAASGEPMLSIEWLERGGPPVTPPARRGFGSRLIEQALARELGGEASLEFAPGGLECHMRFPLGRRVEREAL